MSVATDHRHSVRSAQECGGWTSWWSGMDRRRLRAFVIVLEVPPVRPRYISAAAIRAWTTLDGGRRVRRSHGGAAADPDRGTAESTYDDNGRLTSTKDTRGSRSRTATTFPPRDRVYRDSLFGLSLICPIGAFP